MEFGGNLQFCLLNNRKLYSTNYYRGGQQYQYSNYLINVDSGRSALQYIIETFNFKRIWLPVYNCPLVGKRLQDVSNIKVCWYNLNDDFTPMINHLNFQEDDALLWVNYCGVMYQDLVDKIADCQKLYGVKVIIDNIPAYFSKPRIEVLNIYSCRKFIGVPDGGHVIGKEVIKKELPTYNTAENYYYLLKAFEQGSNASYEDYQLSEKRITEETKAYGMPKLTQKFLESVDYEYVQNTRYDNFQVLHKFLGESNRLNNVDFNSKTPSVYPYLTSNKNLRSLLLDNQIYISRFWKNVLTNERANSFEKDLAEYLIPLPIDQRYTEDDMITLAHKVIELEKLG